MSFTKIATFILLIVVVGFCAQTATAQMNGFGLGIIAGEPTGIAFKGWMGQTTALDAALAWSFAHETTFHVHVDYIFHTDGVTKRADLPVYYGIGGRIKTGGTDADRVGVRIVGGIAYYIPDAPIDLFGEIVPVIDVAPDFALQLNIAIGARYFFR